MSTYKLVCPHCQGRMRIRTSEGQHIFLRITYMQCTNEACGWSVRAEFQMTHELSPSGMPNPPIPDGPQTAARQTACSPGPTDPNCPPCTVATSPKGRCWPHRR
ncbi:ogr/Delta-like zinc finger family protein [Pseudomonas sp. 52 E 6]|uniref:ogr/Delta-like zinc finger family protein n=1 Tax=Pseudomonas sp. 52 E 6 TaxID=1844106 RepID=UPI00211443E8|nr:ogr/Delta-like zinc finger family protein [Pseudomonas sp. 52 E 6]